MHVVRAARSLAAKRLALPVLRPLSVKSTDLVVPPGGVQVYGKADAFEDPTSRASSFEGIEREVFMHRTAKIFQPAKAVTTSGKNVTAKWRIAFPTPERWTNGLMGWTSARDPLSNFSMDFSTVEQATRYAEAIGVKYEVVKPKAYRVKPKAYADNFVWRGPKLSKQG